jgi:uncharacterized protein YjbJ (UPF0337 family)
MRAFLASGREGDDFDPVAAAAAYGLAGDEARAIWQRVRREGRDDAVARRRFHEQARAAARPIAPPPVVGRRSLVEHEAAPRPSGRASLASAAPGRTRGAPEQANLASQAGRASRAGVAGGPTAIHRKAASGVVDAAAAERVAAARKDGAPLDAGLRARLEAALGADLGHVRVHTDAAADLAARALGARAFAIGDDLFFARGAYDPARPEGQRLIAHEVAHVVQARPADASRSEGLAISEPGDAHEQEADAFAERFAQASPAATLGRARASALEAIAGPGARRPIQARTAALVSRTPDDGAAPTGSKEAARPSVPPSAAPAPSAQRSPVPPTPAPPAAKPAPAPAPAAPAPRPAAPAPAPAPAARPAPAAVPVAAPSAPAASAGVTATGGFAAQIRAIAARQKQALTTKATTVKAELTTAIASEKAKVIVGFTQTLAKMQADRDHALADLTSHAETSRTQVRTAARDEHARLDRALARQQQAARTTGDTLATSALTQATQQGDRALQGSLQRAASARAVGEKWAGQFATLEGGEATAADVRTRAADLATRLIAGAGEARQTCLDHGTKFAADLRQDAADVAARMPEKLTDARGHIDKHQGEALQAIADGVQSARDGIAKSFGESRQQVLDKRAGATDVYDQLAQGTTQQLDEGVRQLTAKLDPIAEDIASHAAQAEAEGARYAVSDEVTATIRQRIAGVVNDALGKLTGASGQAEGALDTARAQGQQGAQQQTAGVLGQLDTAGAGMRTSLTGKVASTAGKLGEAATSAVTNLATITPAADTAMAKVVTQGQTRWSDQLTTNVTKLSGGVDDALAHQDSQVSKLDTDLGNQFGDAKAKQDKARSDQSWWSSAWDSFTSFMGDVFSFLGGLVVGFFEAAWELIKGLWDILHTLWGVLILIAIIIIVVLIVVFVGWEALIIAGVILGLCFAAYYIYLAVTTPGLSPYERGKLFGKALFNIALGVAGIEFEWGELLNVAKWVPEAVELVRALGSLGKAIELVRAVGGIGKAMELIRALGSVEKLLELAEAAGGIAKLVELIKAAGGAAKLLELAEAVGGLQKLIELAEAAGGLAKLIELADAAGGITKLLALAKDAGGMAQLLDLVKEAGGMAQLLELAQKAGGLSQLLALAKDAGGFSQLVALAKATGGLEALIALAQKAGGMAALAQIVKDVGGIEKLLAMIKEAGTFEDLLKLATELGGWPKLAKLAEKAGGIAALEALLNDAKIGRSVKLLEDLLDHPLITDAATLTRLLKHAKVASGTELLELLKQIDTVERLLKMLDLANVPSGTKLLEWLTKAGGKATAARLEDMLNLAAAKGGSVQRMCDVAAGSASEFQKMADWADILKLVTAKPAYAAPPQVAKYGFKGADTAHFLDHTWEFVDINARVNKSTTMWPRGTTPEKIAEELGQALDRINPAGTTPVKPVNGTPVSDGGVQVGARPAAGGGSEIGQFFPTAGDTIPARAMRAIKALIKP